ncbi:zinc knuckle CX2CX4HX4C containing protein [Tanacetum coccineum]
MISMMFLSSTTTTKLASQPGFVDRLGIARRACLIVYCGLMCACVEYESGVLGSRRGRLDANVPKHVDFDIWLPLALVNEVNDRMKDSLYRDGPWMIRGVPIFLNKWSPSVSLLKEEFSRVLVWVLVKQKTHYRPKVNQSTEGTNGKKNVSTSGNSLKRASMPNVLTSGNGTFSLSNSLQVLNVNDLANVEVELGNKASTSSVKGEGQSATPLVEKINMLEKHIIKGTCVLVDDDGKPVKKVDYVDDHDSEDEVAPVDNEMANFLALKTSGVRYGTKSLLEQYRETYENAEYDYDPYDDELYPYSI